MKKYTLKIVLILVIAISSYAYSCSCSPDDDVTPGGFNPSGFDVVQSKIAFVSNRDGNNEIYVIENKRALKRLTNNSTNDSVPTWSPNGNMIAFVSEQDGYQDIYVMNSDGSSQINITNTAEAWSSSWSPNWIEGAPSWSPDSSRLAYASHRYIWVVNVDGSDQTQLLAGESPKWSPDGSKIAYLLNNKLYTVDSASFTDRKKINSGYLDYCNEMAWSPDGSKMVYTFGKNIYVVNADGTGLTELTENQLPATGPSWSPDGDKIAYATDTDIWIINADGTSKTTIHQDQFSVGDPYWSPDGKKLAFITLLNNFQVCMMDADGSNFTNVTDNPSRHSFPAWSPV